MVRKPLDSIEYELTYLELRPESERLSDTMDPPVVAPRRRDERVDDAVAVYGIAAVDTDIQGCGSPHDSTSARGPPPRGGPGASPCRSTRGADLATTALPTPSSIVDAPATQRRGAEHLAGTYRSLDARAAHALFVASRAS